MAMLDDLTDDLAVRFDIEVKESRLLVQELLGLIGAQPGGVGGFLNKVKAAGLGDKAASWLGDPYPMALSAHEVSTALGADAVEKIARNAGVTDHLASKALGYAIPKLIDVLTPESLRPAMAASPRQAEPSPGRGKLTWGKEGWRLVVPGAALLATVGVIGYALQVGTARDTASLQFPPTVAENAPAGSPAMATQSPQAGNESAAVSGVVASSAETPAAEGTPKPLPGAGHVRDEFAVTAGWIKNLNAAFAGLGFQGESLSPPRPLIAGMERSMPGTPLQAGAQLPQFALAEMTGSDAANMRIALATPKPEATPAEPARQSQAALDFPAIIFPPDSARISSRNLPVLRRIAERIKHLPPGTMVQLSGYTHSTGMSAASLELAERRAEAVSRVLVRNGVSPAMLSAKGYGSASLMARADGTMEGRSTKAARSPEEDRRVDFRVIEKAP